MDEKCTRYDIGKEHAVKGCAFGSAGHRYVIEMPVLEDYEGYYESISIIVRDSDQMPLAVRKVRYVRNLNLLIWETNIKFKEEGRIDPIQAICANSPPGRPVTCPIGGKS